MNAFLGMPVTVTCVRHYNERIASIVLEGDATDIAGAAARVFTLAGEHNCTSTPVPHKSAPGTLAVWVRGRDIAGVWSAIQVERGAIDTRLPSEFGRSARTEGPVEQTNRRAEIAERYGLDHHDGVRGVAR